MISEQHGIATGTSDFPIISESRQKRAKYKRLAHYIKFDIEKVNAIIVLQPVNHVHQRHLGRFIVATAFKISVELSKFILSQK